MLSDLVKNVVLQIVLVCSIKFEVDPEMFVVAPKFSCGWVNIFVVDFKCFSNW